MRKQLRYLLNLLLSPSPSREKQGLIILISFFLALTLWTLATLNQQYPSTLQYPVKIIEVPETLKVESITPLEIQVEASGSGIELISKHLRFNRDTLQFPFISDFSEKGYTDIGSFQTVMQELVGSDLKVTGHWPGRIDVQLSLKSRKSVPLHLNTNIQLRKAYQLDTPPKLSIDSVIVIGPESAIDSITEWFTDPEELQIISEDTSVVINLMQPPTGLQITPQVTRLKVHTSLYTETQIPVSVWVVDQPDEVSVRFSHREIQVTCLVPFDSYEDIISKRDSFRAEIPFDRLDPNFARIIPNVSLPSGVKLIHQEPRELSFVIVDQ